ncbi:MAG: TlpA family protein disulfide reductase [bacterium]
MRNAFLSKVAMKNLRRALVFWGVAAGFLFCVSSADADGPVPVTASTVVSSAPAGSHSSKTEVRVERHKHRHHRVYRAAADAVPDFTMPEVADGRPFHLRAHLGQVVLIDFWATWCGPCRMAIPHLITLEKKFGGPNFTVVGVSLDQQGPAVVRPFASAWKLNYPVVVDSDGSLARSYGGIRAIPTTLVIDRHGSVVGSLVGYYPLEAYEELVRKALKAG